MKEHLEKLKKEIDEMNNFKGCETSRNTKISHIITMQYKVLEELEKYPAIPSGKVEELRSDLAKHHSCIAYDVSIEGMIKKIIDALESIGPAKPEEFAADKYKVIKNGLNDFSIKNLVTGLCYKHVSLTCTRPDIVKFYQEDEAQDLCEAFNIGHKLRMKKEGA